MQERIVNVLACVVEQGPIKLTELSCELGLPKSTTSRILKLLQDARWVRRDPKSHCYMVSGQVVEEAKKTANSETLKGRVWKLLQEVGKAQNLGVFLFELDGQIFVPLATDEEVELAAEVQEHVLRLNSLRKLVVQADCCKEPLLEPDQECSLLERTSTTALLQRLQSTSLVRDIWNQDDCVATTSLKFLVGRPVLIAVTMPKGRCSKCRLATLQTVLKALIEQLGNFLASIGGLKIVCGQACHG